MHDTVYFTLPCHRHTYQYSILPAPFIHFITNGYSQEKKPDKNHRRNKSCHCRRPAETCLHVIGRNTHNITKPHDEKGSKYRNYFYYRIVFHKLTNKSLHSRFRMNQLCKQNNVLFTIVRKYVCSPLNVRGTSHFQFQGSSFEEIFTIYPTII